MVRSRKCRRWTPLQAHGAAMSAPMAEAGDVHLSKLEAEGGHVRQLDACDRAPHRLLYTSLR